MFSNYKLNKYCQNKRYIKNPSSGVCSVCGNNGNYIFGYAIDDQLFRSWGITESQRKYFNQRETLKCQKCGASLRIRNLASAIIEIENEKYSSIKELGNNRIFSKKQIAEINNCGPIHDYLKKLQGLSYSEYNPDYKKKVNHEDLQNLSYKNDSFDYVLTSDTLEHIPDVNLALNEIYRVLKPQGYHIFTIPLIPNREISKKRAEIQESGINYLEEKSYHGQTSEDYLVFSEFGRDFINKLERHKFQVMLYFCNMIFDDYSFVFVTRKET